MAAQFCRWDPELKMTGLRFSNVMEPADYARFRAFDTDPSLRSWNLWSYIDARDNPGSVPSLDQPDLCGDNHRTVVLPESTDWAGVCALSMAPVVTQRAVDPRPQCLSIRLQLLCGPKTESLDCVGSA